jgi:hypothetical protein
MSKLFAILHWLFDCQNPFHLWGFFPVMIWVTFLSLIALYFAPFETLGVLRVHGMVPVTWVLRCLPRAIWFIAGPVAVWHFDFVKTNATQLYKYLTQ